jgi:uncharacterized protein with von Willebrand factor type A (vWA) domain
MRLFRYSRWDGTQTPITDDLSVSKLVDSLSDDILDGLGPDMAFEHMLRRGVPGQFGGIQSMMERLRRARMQQQEQGLFQSSLLAEAEDCLAWNKSSRPTLQQVQSRSKS